MLSKTYIPLPLRCLKELCSLIGRTSDRVHKLRHHDLFSKHFFIHHWTVFGAFGTFLFASVLEKCRERDLFSYQLDQAWACKQSVLSHVILSRHARCATSSISFYVYNYTCAHALRREWHRKARMTPLIGNRKYKKNEIYPSLAEILTLLDSS